MGTILKILVVDDMKSMRLILVNILKALGHEVFEAENGETAITKYLEVKPDLVTLDITMSGMDGLEVLRRIMIMNIDAKIIMVSAAAERDKIVRALQYGAMDFILKPIHLKRIMAALEKIEEAIEEMITVIS